MMRNHIHILNRKEQNKDIHFPRRIDCFLNMRFPVLVSGEASGGRTAVFCHGEKPVQIIR